ncbi:MAG TPA: methylmalonyl-CoA mutase family protein, partial [Amycolatopsis sp.]|nr:methylmalonyl-CoA mutase family protein [Amycolatopsis sp.]
DGSHVIQAKVDEIIAGAREEIARVQDLGGAVAAVESGYMKSQLVTSLAEYRREMESGERILVGVNKFATTEPSPLQAEGAKAIETIDPAVEKAAVTAIEEWRAHRDNEAVERSLAALKETARTTANLFEATVDCARAGVTTGEWSGALREVFGEYRAPTGVSASATAAVGDPALERVRARVRATEAELGHRLRILVGKPGLDGHSNGAEQVAVRARDAGFEVIYQGIRLTPEQIVAAAVQEGVHVVGLSVLSGSHLEVVPNVVDGLRAAGAGDIPVIVGGIIPPDDEAVLLERGIARVFTPKDYELTDIMDGIVTLVRENHGLEASGD